MRVAAGPVLDVAGGCVLYRPVFEQLIGPLEEVSKDRTGLMAINFSGLAGALEMQVQVSGSVRGWSDAPEGTPA